MENGLDKLSCLEARRTILTDPRRRSAELADHLGECNSCASFFGRQTMIEDQLKRAVEVDVPEGLEARIMLAQKLGQKQKNRGKFRWMALAASVLLTFSVVVSTVMLQRPPAIQSFVLEHVHDDHVMMNRENPLKLVELNALLHQHGIRVRDQIGDIYYAKDCIVREKRAAHIVMAGTDTLVTVLFLSSEEVPVKAEFHDYQYQGTIIPTLRGSMAIIAENRSAVIEAEQRLLQVTSYDL